MQTSRIWSELVGDAAIRRDDDTSTARQAKLTGPARVTDIIVRKFPAKPAGRKAPDLTTDAAASAEQTAAPMQNDADHRAISPGSRFARVGRRSAPDARIPSFSDRRAPRNLPMICAAVIL